jgi:AcrR family transcriptional regulator
MNMGKGLSTKENILKAAFDFSSKFGFEALSIGKLAEIVGLSKSGLFSHFKSKEALQCLVLEYSAASFTLEVLAPATKKPRGIPRLEAILDNWINWAESTLTGGCPLLSAAIEFDDRPGIVRAKVTELYQKQIDFYEKAIGIAQAEGQITKSADIKKIAFEFYSLMTGFHIYQKLLGLKKSKSYLKESFKELINKYQ